MTTTDSIDYKLLAIQKKTLTYEQPHALNLTIDNYQHQTSPDLRYQLLTLNTAKKRISSISSYKWNRLPKQLLSSTISPNSCKRNQKKLHAYVKLIIIIVLFLLYCIIFLPSRNIENILLFK